MSPKARHSVREYRGFVLLFIVLIAFVGVVEYLYLSNRKSDAMLQIGKELLGITDIKIQAVARWRRERLNDANFIFRNKSIALDAANIRDDASLVRMKEWMSSMLENGNYRQISFLSPEGRPILTSPKGDSNEVQVELLELAKKNRSVIFSNFYSNLEGVLHIQLVVPLYKDSHRPELAGFIQLITDPNDGLFALVNAWSRPSNTAEILMVTRIGNEVFFLNELRHRKEPGPLYLPISNQNMPSAMVFLGREGFVEGLDYRNVSVFAGVHKVPDSMWAIVAKIDQKEVFEDLNSERTLAILVFVFAILASTAFILLLVKRVQVQQAKEYMHQIQRSKALLNAIIEGTSDAIFAKDRDGRYIMINEACARIWGKPAPEVYGKDASFVVPDDEAVRIRAIDNHVLETGEVITLEEPFNTQDGATKYYLTTKGPILDEAGQRTGVFGISREITQLKKTEQQLRNFQHAVEQSPSSIVITNTNGVIEYVNTRFTEVSGYTAQEVIGKNPKVLKSGQVKPETYAHLWQTITSGKEWRGELCNKKKNGTLYWEDAFIGPVRDSNGQITHFIAVKQDITAHKEMERQLLQAQRMESIGTLAGGIAHDLNNVLAPVLFSVELLKERITEELSLELLSTAEASVHRGREIIRQVLSFARGMEGEKIPIQPRHVLKEIENILRETFPRSIQVRIEIDPELSMISADVTQLHQVLMNLSVNARDAMSGIGTLTITARNVKAEELPDPLAVTLDSRPHICLSVKDTGTGIAPEVMDRIFDPFFTTKDVGKGTGLGLSTVYTIVHKHNGFIHVQSEPGRGSEFQVYLPSIESPAPSTIARQPGLSRGNGEGILIVDDEATVRGVLQQLLESFGYTAYVAQSGREAVKLYAGNQSNIALVITDWMMPEMDGAATIRRLQQVNQAVKVVVATGLMEESILDPQEGLNVLRVLNKPFGAQVLLKTIREVLA